MSKFATESIKKILPYVPGEQPKTKMVKLNTNENPFEIDAKTKDAIINELQNLQLYPDPNSTKLKSAIAQYYNLSASQVFVGNGSDEVLAHIFQAFFANSKLPLAMPDITYSFYKVYSQLFNVGNKHIELDENLKINTKNYIGDFVGIIFPNPNAPTGIFLELQKIEELLKNNSEKIIVVDEAYIDFGGNSAVGLINKYDNLLIVQTFSKSRSLAGLRLGFALANAEIIADLNKVKNSFNSYPVDRLGEVAAISAIENTAEFKKRIKQIIDWRLVLSKGLEKLEFSVIPSCANFVFAKHKKATGAYLLEELKKRNILVRNFADPPRIKDYLRISVGKESDIQALLLALDKILSS